MTEQQTKDWLGLIILHNRLKKTYNEVPSINFDHRAKHILIEIARLVS